MKFNYFKESHQTNQLNLVEDSLKLLISIEAIKSFKLT